MGESMFVFKTPYKKGRAFQTLETIDLELNSEQISLGSNKNFQLTLNRYVDGSREYEIGLKSPVGFYYVFREGKMSDEKKSREKLDELDKCLFYGAKIVILDRNRFDVI